jgi:MSHA biogenesis protein MshJ
MKMPEALVRRWAEGSARYAALSRRERALLAGVLVGGIAYLGVLLWIEPRWAATALLDQQAERARAALRSVQAQSAALAQQLASDPDQPGKARLAALDAQLAGLEARLANFQVALVPPQQAVGLLENLIPHHPGVRIVGFATLPAEGLLAAHDPAVAGKSAEKATADKASPPQTNAGPVGGEHAIEVYRHGFELKLEGNYLDLLAYLKALEAQPQRLLWQRARLAVRDYPIAELTLNVYTLSFDKHWLVL